VAEEEHPIFRGGPQRGRGGGRGALIFRGGPGKGVAEEGVALFQGKVGKGRGGGGFHKCVLGEGRAGGRGGGGYGGRTEGGGGGALAWFLYLDRARLSRLTWGALKPNGLPLGSS